MSTMIEGFLYGKYSRRTIVFPCDCLFPIDDLYAKIFQTYVCFVDEMLNYLMVKRKSEDIYEAHVFTVEI